MWVVARLTCLALAAIVVFGASEGAREARGNANDYAAANATLLPGSSFIAEDKEVFYAWFSGQYQGTGADVIAARDIEVQMSVIWRPVPHRIVAATGDLCFGPPFGFGEERTTPVPVPCAEGDVALTGPNGTYFDPSIGGWACYDGADNDGDNLNDAADPDCRYVIDYVTFTGQATGQFRTFYRAVAFLCPRIVPGGFNGSVGMRVSGPVAELNNTNNVSEAFISVVCTPP